MFILIFLLLFSRFHINNAIQKIGDICRISDSLQGQCVLLKNCDEILNILIKGEESNHIGCDYDIEERQEIVCCPNSALGPPSLTIITNTTTESIELKLVETFENADKDYNLTMYEDNNEPKLIFSRISQKKCKEYQEPIFEKWSYRNINDEIVVRNLIKCPHVTQPYIVGGSYAAPLEFPHMALIGSSNSSNLWFCGGTLISDEYVLTAAHCNNNSKFDADIIRLGELDYESKLDNSEPQNFRIIDRILHPNYTNSLAYNDIALFRLDRKVNFSSYIRPACLSTLLSDYTEDKAIATGWGATRGPIAGVPSTFLKKVVLEKFNFDECNSFYKNLEDPVQKLSKFITNSTQLCAGSHTSIDDTCSGDSGGPLQIYHSDKENYNCMYSVIGITSLGPFCGIQSPGVYTNVYSYLDWIESIVWSNEKL